MEQNSTELMQQIVAVLRDKLAFNVEVINVGEVSIIADYFVIASGRTDSHVRALYDYVDEGIKEKLNIDPIRREGIDNARWIVMDYGSVIVHIFRNDEREFYNIEKLWAESDAAKVDIENDKENKE